MFGHASTDEQAYRQVIGNSGLTRNEQHVLPIPIVYPQYQSIDQQDVEFEPSFTSGPSAAINPRMAVSGGQQYEVSDFLDCGKLHMMDKPWVKSMKKDDISGAKKKLRLPMGWFPIPLGASYI